MAEPFTIGIVRYPKKVQIRSPEQVAVILKRYSNSSRELLIVLHFTPLLDAFAEQVVAVGTMTSLQFEMTDVFREGIRLDSKCLVVAHTHPFEDDLVVSEKDEYLTARMIRAGQALGMPILDHIILGTSSYRSLRANGNGGFTKSSDYRDSLGEFGSYFVRVRHKVSNTFVCQSPRKRKKRKNKKKEDAP